MGNKSFLLVLLSLVSNLSYASECALDSTIITAVVDNTEKRECLLVDPLAETLSAISHFLPERPDPVTVQVEKRLPSPSMGFDGTFYIGETYQNYNSIYDIPLPIRITLWSHEYGHHVFNHYIKREMPRVADYVYVYTRGRKLEKKLIKLKRSGAAEETIENMERELKGLEARYSPE